MMMLYYSKVHNNTITHSFTIYNSITQLHDHTHAIGKTSISEQQWYFGDGRGSLRAKKGRQKFWGWSCEERGI